MTRPSVGTEGRTMWRREEEGKEEESEDRGKGRKLSEWQSGFREGMWWAKDALTELTYTHLLVSLTHDLDTRQGRCCTGVCPSL